MKAYVCLHNGYRSDEASAEMKDLATNNPNEINLDDDDDDDDGVEEEGSGKVKGESHSGRWPGAVEWVWLIE